MFLLASFAQLGLYACPACPADCDVAVAPAFDINECADAITFYASEISVIFLAGVSDADCTLPEVEPTVWTSGANWASVLALTGAAKIRQIFGIGDMPEPTSTPIVFSKGRTKNGIKTFVVNFDIDEYNATNYAAMRLLECGYTGFIWIQTRGGMLYGGQHGIKVNITKAFAPKARGENVYEKITLEIQWQANCSPDMIVSPITQAAC